MPDKRPSLLSTFLGRITRNLAINRLEKRTRQKRGGGQTVLALDELAECLPAPGSVEQEVEAAQLRQAIDSFLGGLGETERKIFVARYWFLAPIGEIAGKLGSSEGKVKTSLYRTRGKLRAFLKEAELC